MGEWLLLMSLLGLPLLAHEQVWLLVWLSLLVLGCALFAIFGAVVYDRSRPEEEPPPDPAWLLSDPPVQEPRRTRYRGRRRRARRSRLRLGVVSIVDLTGRATAESMRQLTRRVVVRERQREEA